MNVNKIVMTCVGALAGGGLGFLVGWKVRDHILDWDDEDDDFEIVMEYEDGSEIGTDPDEADDNADELEPSVISKAKGDILKEIKAVSKKRKEEREKARYVEVEDGERVVPGQDGKPDISSVAGNVDYSKLYNTASDVVEKEDDVEVVSERLDYKIISVQEYTHTEPFFEKRVLAWYKDDHVIADDDLNPVSGNLMDFQKLVEMAELTDEPVYIRVADRKIDYEFYLADGTYQEALEDARGE